MPTALQHVEATSLPTEIALDDLQKFARLGLITLFQFQVENLIANLIRALGRRPRRAYQAAVDQLLALLGWTDTDRAARVFRVAGVVRNSLHNNGFHDGADLDVRVHGFRYRATRGGRMRTAGWGHVTHVLRAELRLLERILSDPAIRSLNRVEDRYARLVSGQQPASDR